MQVKISKVNDITVAGITGDVDGSTAPQVQEQILSEVETGGKLVLDMSAVPYMSSAGLRMLLVMYRNLVGQGGKVVLVGLSEDLKDTMEMTGFLEFFDHYDDLDAGLAATA